MEFWISNPDGYSVCNSRENEKKQRIWCSFCGTCQEGASVSTDIVQDSSESSYNDTEEKSLKKGTGQISWAHLVTVSLFQNTIFWTGGGLPTTNTPQLGVNEVFFIDFACTGKKGNDSSGGWKCVHSCR